MKSIFKLLILWTFLTVLLIACAPKAEDELEGSLGTGSGGDVVGTNLTSKDITKSDSTITGTLKYDADYFTEIPTTSTSENPLIFSLVGTTQTSLSLLFVTIDESGFKTNDKDLEIYQVNVHKDSNYTGFFCSELKDNNGISITVTGTSKEELSYLQVYAILNSLQSL